MATAPNILLILSDQHHADALGCAGHRQALTPNFDRFAASGVRFTRAYTQNTICTPSRVSILSGQYCHNHGHYGLSGPARFGLDNLMRHCRANGYRTAAYGKLHLPDEPRNWLADDLDEFGDSYEGVDGEKGRSEFLDGLERDGLRHLEDSWHIASDAYGPHGPGWDGMVSKLPYERTQEVWSAEKAMAFMDTAGDRPFCIQVGWQKPHHPLLPQRRFLDLYPEDLDLPATFDLTPEHRPPHFRQAREQRRNYDWPAALPGDDALAGPRRAWRATLACVSQIDDVFGRLLDHLEQRGLAENTIVVYGADHGGYHMVHGILEKAPGICSDAVCRVPLLWRGPGVAPGQVRHELVENVDITPTLARLCGLPEFATADGLDITPLLGGGGHPVRRVAVTENVFAKAIHWDRWRLVHYPDTMFGDETGELYNLESDPDESRNLHGDPAHAEIVHQGRRLLLDWLITTTRVTDAAPVVLRRHLPLCTDGRGPNAAQPRFSPGFNRNYA